MEKQKSDKEIIEHYGMANLPLIISELYKKYGTKFELIDIGGDCMFRIGQTNVANVSYLATYINFLKINDDELTIEGNVSWPTVLLESFDLNIEINGELYSCDMYDAGLDLKNNSETYETRTAFKYILKLRDNEKYVIRFIYYCNGIKCYSGKINYMRFSPIADLLTNQYAERDGWILKNKDASIVIEKSLDNIQNICEERFRKEIEYSDVVDIRKKYFEKKMKKNKPIWLFMDRIDRADDNGEVFFRYINRKHPDVADCYYVLSAGSDEYERVKKHGKVISAMSDEHKAILPLADYIFTSQLNGWVENPYGDKEEYFRDIYHQAKVIFLQHGVTKDNHTKWLNRLNQDCHAIVSSSDKEQKAFIKEKYFYNPEQIWNVGMPRFDKLYRDKAKYVLFLPTWRKDIMEQQYDDEEEVYRWVLRPDGDKSAYFKRYSEVLSNEEFISNCEKQGYQVAYMPHPLVEPFMDKMKISDRVVLIDKDTHWRDIFAKSAIMVTDYSSVAFDFAYLKKPIIYYQFDADTFFEGHTYSKGYFDYYNDGFGEVVTSKETLLESIYKILKKKGRMSFKYYIRVRKFYTHIDKGNCKRLYRKIMKENRSEYC